MEITETIYVTTREEWRRWLAENHDMAAEIWVMYPRKSSGKACLPYDEAVEEALCFGWIDGIQKPYGTDSSTQRWTPRRAKSNWSALNKERARRLLEAGQMTDAGRAVLCDLSDDTLELAGDIEAALNAAPPAWEHFQAFPVYYQRVRVGYIEEARNQPAVFAARLAHFVQKTAQNKRFGTLR